MGNLPNLDWHLFSGRSRGVLYLLPFSVSLFGVAPFFQATGNGRYGISPKGFLTTEKQKHEAGRLETLPMVCHWDSRPMHSVCVCGLPPEPSDPDRTNITEQLGDRTTRPKTRASHHRIGVSLYAILYRSLKTDQ